MKTLQLSIIAITAIIVLGTVSFFVILDSRHTLPKQTIIPEDNQVTLTRDYAWRVCGALGLPCPSNPIFRAKQMDNQSYVVIVEVNGKPHTVTLNDSATCVTPPLYGRPNCYFETNQKTWVEIDPIQCGGNPWEKDWLESHPDDFSIYARLITNEKIELIKNYYKKQDIEIFDVKSFPWEDVAVCESCSCPAGYTLSLLVSNSDVDKMLELGYKISKNQG